MGHLYIHYHRLKDFREPVFTRYTTQVITCSGQQKLARYGITPEHLATAFKKWGVSWEAVGAYNAGFRKTERQNQRRLAYASDIYRIYTGIKSSKGIRLPAMEESFSKINGVQNN